MSCESCATLLTDLAREGIDPRDASAARAHLEQCSRCHDCFGGVPASQKAAGRNEAILEQNRFELIEASRPSLVELLETLGRFAMSRQVAMGTLTLLIVAFGLWHVPRMSHAPAAAGDSVAHSPEVEAENAAAISPAEPLDLTLDLRNGRIRPKNAQGDAPAHVSRSKAAEAAARASAREVGQASEASEHSSHVEDDSRRSGFGYDTHVGDPASATSMTAGTLGAARHEGLFAGPETMGLAPAESAAETLHARAQRLLASGRWRAASKAYRRLLGRHPRYPERAEALLELADCYEKRGRIEEARRRLQQVARHPRLRELALRRLDALRARAKPGATASR